MFQYLLYRLTHVLVNHLPLSLSYWIGDRIADLHFIFSIKSRRQIVQNFRWVYNTHPKATHREVREVFQNFGEYLVDFLRLSRLEQSDFFKCVEVKGLEHIQSALEKGRGVIGITAHFGNWEWGGVSLSLQGYPVHALALDHRNHRVNQFFLMQRAKKRVHTIPMTDSIWRVVQYLAKNEVLLLVADRDFSNNGIPVTFLGRKVYFPRGPAALSRRCGSPLVVGFVIRQKRGFFKLVFEPPIETEKTKDYSGDLQKTTQKIAVLLEDYIRRYPTQWFLFQGAREVADES